MAGLYHLKTAMFEVGEQVGDYQIVARLKSGGMATLFLGRRRGASGFAKHVAIKVIHPHLAEDPAFVRMFVDEALLSARIQHPNVVHVEELKRRDGKYFLVMEYVHGVALVQLLRTLGRKGRRLAPDLAVQIAARIADGLHAAHETRDPDGQTAGVVHRDVSPQNVLLAWAGHVKLIDFGVAKAHGRATHTIGGSLKGKVRYMSTKPSA
jgi:eukaryotic-like serine/threonine-protein kinase